MRKMETVNAEVRQMRKELLWWRWTEQSEMQTGGCLSCGCWTLPFDYGSAGDKTFKELLKKGILKRQRSVEDAPTMGTSAPELSSIHFMDSCVICAALPGFGRSFIWERSIFN